MVEKEVPTKPFNLSKRPQNVRRRKADLTARVNGNLQLEFGDVALTSYAGLELFGRYLRVIQFNKLVRERLPGQGRGLTLDSCLWCDC